MKTYLSIEILFLVSALIFLVFKFALKKIFPEKKMQMTPVFEGGIALLIAAIIVFIIAFANTKF